MSYSAFNKLLEIGSKSCKSPGFPHQRKNEVPDCDGWLGAGACTAARVSDCSHASKKSLHHISRAFKKYQRTHKSLQNPENIREAIRRHYLISHLRVQKEISNRRFPGKVSYTCSNVNSKTDGNVPANLATSGTGRTGAQPGLTMSVGLSKCCTNTWLSSCSRIHLQHPPGEPYSCLGKRQILGITSIRVFTYCRMVPWSCWRQREVKLECQVSWH